MTTTFTLDNLLKLRKADMAEIIAQMATVINDLEDLSGYTITEDIQHNLPMSIVNQGSDLTFTMTIRVPRAMRAPASYEIVNWLRGAISDGLSYGYQLPCVLDDDYKDKVENAVFAYEDLSIEVSGIELEER